MAKTNEGGSVKVTSDEDVDSAVVPAVVPTEPKVESAVVTENTNRADAPKAPEAPKAPAPVVRVVSDTAPEMILIATENCSPTIGKYRLNLVKDRKFKVPSWVGEDLLRSKVAVKA